MSRRKTTAPTPEAIAGLTEAAPTKLRQFEAVREGAIIPERKTKLAAGYDLHALETVTLRGFETKVVPTGVTVQMQDDEVLLLRIRSSIARDRGLILGAGVIDADYYPHEIGLVLHNPSANFKTVDAGERIAQGIFHKYLTTDEEAPVETERTGGFGTTNNENDQNPLPTNNENGKEVLNNEPNGESSGTQHPTADPAGEGTPTDPGNAGPTSIETGNVGIPDGDASGKTE